MRGAGLSLEMWKIAKAECVPVHEGSTCVIVMRDDVASPGSKAVSRMKVSVCLWPPTGLVAVPGYSLRPDPIGLMSISG